jgi:hypothetical protein
VIAQSHQNVLHLSLIDFYPTLLLAGSTEHQGQQVLRPHYHICIPLIRRRKISVPNNLSHDA